MVRVVKSPKGIDQEGLSGYYYVPTYTEPEERKIRRRRRKLRSTEPKPIESIQDQGEGNA